MSARWVGSSDKSRAASSGESHLTRLLCSGKSRFFRWNRQRRGRQSDSGFRCLLSLRFWMRVTGVLWICLHLCWMPWDYRLPLTRSKRRRHLYSTAYCTSQRHRCPDLYCFTAKLLGIGLIMQGVNHGKPGATGLMKIRYLIPRSPGYHRAQPGGISTED